MHYSTTIVRVLKARVRINNDLQVHCVLTGSVNGKNLKTMNGEGQEWLPCAEGTCPRPVFGSDVVAREAIDLSSEPSETRSLKEREPGKAENSDEGWWRSYYKDDNTARYVISKC
jgi:hypothetical protein